MAKSAPAKKQASKTATKKTVKQSTSPTSKKSSPKGVTTKKDITATPAKKAKKEYQIKYSDKSAGQPELVVIFEQIKKMMLPYVKAPIVLVGGTGGMMTLVSKKPVEIAGRKRDELWFAGLLVQKGYVGFYFMPIYGEPGIAKSMQPELLKCLKGKSCFHIKKNDPQIMAQIKDALKLGYEGYRKKGWV